MQRTVLLLGATGLVGHEVLLRLLDDPGVAKVVVIGRRPSGKAHAKLAEHVFDLDSMEAHPEVFRVDQIFCALGTTIRRAGSEDRFRVVDHDYPITAARLGRAGGARHYLLVSSLGANRKSRVFYSRVKGEVEADLIALGYPGVTIARPSLLAGTRTEFRLGEQIGLRFGWLMPPKVRPIEARDVAQALVRLAREDRPGVRIVESKELKAIARR